MGKGVGRRFGSSRGGASYKKGRTSGLPAVIYLPKSFAPDARPKDDRYALVAAANISFGLAMVTGAGAIAVPAAGQEIGTVGTYRAIDSKAGAVGTAGTNGDGNLLGCTVTPTGGAQGKTPDPTTLTYSESIGSATGLVYATSAGGAGGAGGNNVESGIYYCARPAGGGGTGGNGAAVAVKVQPGTTSTTATAIVAQSQGGVGGNGGANNNSGQRGGDGGTGGRASAVTVTNSRSIIASDGNLQNDADSSAIYAYSAGGNGGNGGSAGGLLYGGLAGSPGVGGDGGGVTVKNTGALTTPNGPAIFAESLGGTGGAGGSAKAGLFGGGVGTGGGIGGSGGAVVVDNAGAIQTRDIGDQAIFAQSVGGGGGNGGTKTGYGTIGASGGPAGKGGAVTITNSGTVTTIGASTAGLYAQSVGGGGGLGGLAFASGTSALAVGGSGGEGGDASAVRVVNSGTICTGGECFETVVRPGSFGLAYGIFAQSVGGGGGEGALAASAGVAGTSIAIGGSGGKGGAGAAVSVLNSGNVTTKELNSSAIFAQSVGGGGGLAGGAVSLAAGLADTLSLGGARGVGGSGSTVVVNCLTGSSLAALSAGCLTADKLANSLGNTTLSTKGDFSSAIFAQSVGGGGGTGGFAASFSGSLVGVNETHGGSGGAAGNGSAVYAGTGGSTLRTTGNDAAGLFAQSVGGGGGNGGSTANTSVAIASFGESFGGGGGGGGSGGMVVADNLANGLIATSGDSSAGIFAQSVGGGGGNGGLNLTSSAAVASLNTSFGGNGGNGNVAGAVVVANIGSITTGADGRGDVSAAIFAQSVGGGGGNGGGVVNGGKNAGSFSFVSKFGGAGGSGGTGADGGTVAVNCFVDGANSAASSAACAVPYGSAKPVIGSANALSTNGFDAPGIFAQSVGGGGGNGGFVVSASASLLANVGNSLGGTGGSGADGGEVYASTGGGNITTRGGNSSALVAQSVGGGGGDGGLSLSGDFAGGISLTSTIGGSGGAGGAGRQVIVDNSGGSLATAGAGSSVILAQSIGGGGGNGGDVLNVGGAGSFKAGLSIGGSGGIGADAGEVHVTTAADLFGSSKLSATGANSSGIVAQSIGGGGGNGGEALTLSGGGAGAVSLAFGGAGAAGGIASLVTVKSTNTAYDIGGDDSSGIIAQSIGGGGGTGGTALAGAFSGVASIAQSFGGAGGKGGTAGVVEVDLTGGAINTRGVRSDAVIAQSIGGAGGNAGSSASLAGSVTGVALALAMGGVGGIGGVSGDVTVNNVNGDRYSASSITTGGLGSSGIVAQSIGGAGGNGGFAVAGAASIAGGSAGAIGIGGSGGQGGASGVVRVTNQGSVTSQTGGSALILAQSIGGSGGNGGFSVAGAVSAGSAGALSIGGGGGTGGIANLVEVVNSGSLAATANAASNTAGILAQSIGGSGGNGGFSVAGALSPGWSVGIAAGGGGGSGGRGLDVNVTNSGLIQTTGALSYAIEAQSIGGNGGNGGNGGFAVAGAIGSGTAAAVATGGAGGDGGVSGNVRVMQNFPSNSLVSTQGAAATAILAQSIGGSGGDAGFTFSGSVGGGAALATSIGAAGGNGGVSGDVFVGLTGAGTVQTSGANAAAIKAQSIAGSGGDGSYTMALAASTTAAVAVSVGGNGGSGGKAGNVVVDNGSTIRTTGDLSAGITAFSIGGNGGSGGDALSGAGAFGNPKLTVAVAASKGGTGGKADNAGTVTVTSSGAVSTAGLRSIGIEAQSVGGDGGDGGNAVAFAATAPSKEGGKAVAAAVAVGGAGAAGGNGSTVTVTQNGTVSTAGGQSTGIFAQSVGGGGGTGGSATSRAMADDGAVSVAIGGGGADGGIGGSVAVTSNNAITTTGDQAVALRAQSVGGGGGTGGESDAQAQSKRYAAAVGIGGFGGGGGDVGTVSISASSVLTTSGALASGIFAQSVGGGGGDGGASITSAKATEDALPWTSGAASSTGMGSATGDSQVQSAVPGAKSAPMASTSGSAAKPEGGESKEPDDGIAAAFGIGGSGGGGGIGGAVTVGLAGTGRIATGGQGSNGIFAQSVGGGGGNGGESSSEAEGDKWAGSFSLGGSGGGGQKGGDVGVTTDRGSAITVKGLMGTGIFAQSVGGGGGNGGAVEASSTAGEKGAASFGLGGSGGDGADGGSVTVNANGALTSSGVGIFAQSVGGGGGNGGHAEVKTTVGDDEEEEEQPTPDSVSKVVTAGAGKTSNKPINGNAGTGAQANNTSGKAGTEAGADAGFAVGMALGGTGGGGGNGGNVAVVMGGSITIAADALANSHGIFAQSVGGGGGNAGETTNEGKASKGSLAVALGMSGGKGGTGGLVTVSSSGAILTRSTESTAIFAQSVGGGGGTGGAAETTSETGGDAALALALGGTGGDGGAGQAVTVTSTGTLQTIGDLSYGIFAQSVGGGGGSGGDVISSAKAGDVEEDQKNATIANAMNGDEEAQASAGVAVAAALGGTGGKGGAGGAVTVSATSIATAGRESTAIFAQSVGGGGGNSGVVTVNANDGAAAASFALGGTGGDGGAGGAVTVTAGAANTTGDLAHGVFAQSVGGGGGNALAAETTTASGGDANIGFSLGMSGGNASAGGAVSVRTTDAVSTTGNGALGVFAQSIGGGGGTAEGSFGNGGAEGANLSMAFGNSGGSGGNGNAVTVSLGRGVTTSGMNAVGVLAQSVGGGGGEGSNTEISVTSAGTNNVKSAVIGFLSPTLTLGGKASVSGDGGAVVFKSDPVFGTQSIRTLGAGSAALIAQSIGGGGGNADNATVSSGATGITFKAALGSTASSSTPGKGGTVTADLTGLYALTAGTNAPSVLLQSIGGGGGSSATSDVLAAGRTTNTTTFSLGGTNGGAASAVGVTANSGVISASGTDSSGLLLQAIGGGGGFAAQSITGSTSTTVAGDAPSLSLASSRLGATTGSGAGAAVNATLTGATAAGAYKTAGNGAVTLAAQSIGGGGGMAALALSSAMNLSNRIQLGGGNVGASDGDTVTLTLKNWDIAASGGNSAALVAQSIGRGGGILSITAPALGTVPTTYLGADKSGGGAATIGNGGTIKIDGGGATVSDYGINGIALLAQSIGGGGGLSLTPGANLVLGSSFNNASVLASSPSAGGVVTIANMGAVGAARVGVIAQSVGGGGGVGEYSGTASLGGTGSADRSNGGNVSIAVNNTVQVSADNAVAVIAQSVGGGGGVAIATGNVAAGQATFLAGTGNGGTVSVTTTAGSQINATGKNSIGILAQSVGGGGGMVLGSDGVQLKSGGGTGIAGAITLNILGNINASGQGGRAIVVRGGAVSSNKGLKIQHVGIGAIAIAAGNPSAAQTIPVVAQAVAADDESAGGQVVNIAAGVTIVGGTGPDGAGIEFGDGDNTLLIGKGAVVASADPTGGLAIHSLSGSVDIENDGEIHGNLGLAFNPGGTLRNKAGGVFLAAPNEALGGGTLVNEGLFASMEPAIARTLIDGAFQQTATGTTVVRVDQHLGQSDGFAITGPVTMDGKLVLALQNLGLTKQGRVDYGDIFATPSGATLAGLTIAVPQIPNSVVERFAAQVDGGGIDMVSVTDFTPVGSSKSARFVGSAIAQVQDAGSTPLFQQVTQIALATTSVDDLNRKYDALGANMVSAAPQASLNATSRAIATAQDRIDGWRIGDPDRLMRQGGTQQDLGGRRIWGTLDGDITSGRRVDGHQIGGSAGVDVVLPDKPVIVGAAVSYSQGTYRVGAPVSLVAGKQFSGTLYGAGQVGRAYLSGSFTIGGGDSLFTHDLSALGLAGQSKVRFAELAIGGHLELDYSVPLTRGLVATPYIAIAPMAVIQGGGVDTYAGLGTVLRYQRSTVAAMPTYIGAQLHGSVPFAGGVLEPFARVAWMHDFSPDRIVDRNFIDLPSYTIKGNALPIVEDAVALKAGGSVRLGQRVSVQLSGDAELSGARQSYGGQATLSFKW